MSTSLGRIVRGRGLALGLLLSLGFAEPARASESITTLETPSDQADRPWAQGVSTEKQEAARAPFEEGNTLLQDSLFKGAAQKYEQALGSWDHPGIHFNLALALLNLEKPVEAYEHFKKAIAYGAAPIDEDKVERAKSYIALLEQQLATVQLRCDEPEAVVRFDGRQVFVAPGKAEFKVKIGDHIISATKPGFERTDLTRLVKPKEVLDLDLKIYRPEELVTYKRKFAGWVPVIPIVGGALAIGGGVAFGLAAQNSYQEFDANIGNSDCDPGEPVCPPATDDSDLKGQGDLYQTLSIVSYGVGGALLATGFVLFVINRPVAERVTPDQMNRDVAFTPWFGPGGGGLSAKGRF